MAFTQDEVVAGMASESPTIWELGGSVNHYGVCLIETAWLC